MWTNVPWTVHSALPVLNPIGSSSDIQSRFFSGLNPESTDTMQDTSSVPSLFHGNAKHTDDLLWK